uniref:Uncharacterized protein n=1 Tax=Panagrolaimus sp. ES5 TaxID=591445 RepID=A0AC34G882_9BILA
MSTTSAEIIPEYSTTYLPINKNTTTMYINGPSVSATQTTITHQLPNGYATTTNGYSAAPEFTNLTPLMSGPPPTSQFTAQQILANTSFLNDHSNPTSASSSGTKLQNIGLGEDSGISSHNGSLLMSGIGGGLPQMNGFGSPQMEIKLEDDLDPMPRDRCNTWPLRRPTLDINAQ